MSLLSGTMAGVGSGMVSNVENNRQNDRDELLRQHQTTLQNMRQKSMDLRQEDTQAHEFEKYDKQRGDTVSDLAASQEYDKKNYDRDRVDAGLDAERDQQFELDQIRARTSGAIELAELKNNPDEYKSVKVKINEYVGDSPLPVEREIPLSYHSQSGRYYIEQGGKLMPYSLIENLSEVEKNLASNPLDAMAWAQANGGPESLPAWFKVQHEGAYKAVKKEYEKTEDVGGGNKELLTQATAAREEMAPIDIPPGRSPESVVPPKPGWGGDFSNHKRPESKITMENAGKVARSIGDFMMSPADEMFAKKEQ
jgi:hypothetical protein